MLQSVPKQLPRSARGIRRAQRRDETQNTCSTAVYVRWPGILWHVHPNLRHVCGAPGYVATMGDDPEFSGIIGTGPSARAAVVNLLNKLNLPTGNYRIVTVQ